jgi:mono/diheme cytochrome c family protein
MAVEMDRRVVAVASISLMLAAGIAGIIYIRAPSGPSPQTISEGGALYQKNCAACHGVNLEGQPNWKTPLPSGTLPAPPHDASGHTWHHPTSLLFKITKKGASAVVGGGYKSDMGGFERILSDDQISAILEFIKSRWPERERNYHEEMNRRELERAN